MNSNENQNEEINYETYIDREENSQVKNILEQPEEDINNNQGYRVNNEGDEGQLTMSKEAYEKNLALADSIGENIVEEDDSTKFQLKKGFVLKTYGIFLFLLLITIGIMCLTFIENIKITFQSFSILQVILLILAMSVTITICLVLFCKKDAARRVPINYILVFVYVICFCYCLLFICAFYGTVSVLAALSITGAASIGITLYAWKCKVNFGLLKGWGCSLGFMAPFTALFCFLWNLKYCLIMTAFLALFSLYLIYDTQLMIGNLGSEYLVDDYIIASLNLYMDIIYLFIKILSIIGGEKRK